MVTAQNFFRLTDDYLRVLWEDPHAFPDGRLNG